MARLLNEWPRKRLGLLLVAARVLQAIAVIASLEAMAMMREPVLERAGLAPYHRQVMAPVVHRSAW